MACCYSLVSANLVNIRFPARAVRLYYLLKISRYFIEYIILPVKRSKELQQCKVKIPEKMFVLLCSKCALAFSQAISNSAHFTYITKCSLYIPP